MVGGALVEEREPQDLAEHVAGSDERHRHDGEGDGLRHAQHDDPGARGREHDEQEAPRPADAARPSARERRDERADGGRAEQQPDHLRPGPELRVDELGDEDVRRREEDLDEPEQDDPADDAVAGDVPDALGQVGPRADGRRLVVGAPRREGREPHEEAEADDARDDDRGVDEARPAVRDGDARDERRGDGPDVERDRLEGRDRGELRPRDERRHGCRERHHAEPAGEPVPRRDRVEHGERGRLDEGVHEQRDEAQRGGRARPQDHASAVHAVRGDARDERPHERGDPEGRVDPRHVQGRARERVHLDGQRDGEHAEAQHRHDPAHEELAEAAALAQR